MKIALVTLFPEMFAAITDYGISGRAVSNGLLEVKTFNPRQFTDDKHQTVDDRPYGGGPGMVMLIEPLRQAIDAARQWQGDGSKVIYLSPQGRVLNQQGVNTLVKESKLILVAGRYEGIDERLIQQEVDEEWSIGDYVLSGGELPAMVLMDAVIRHLPGVLGHQDSALEDSFAEGLLDCPHYTRPVMDGQYQAAVPDVLLSGNHEKIRQWRLRQSLERTLTRRPELLKDLPLSDEQQAILAEIEAQQAD
ncbi:tRNA (guanosine(37)-N1)-methyltransferase TrmD [Porticoccus sp. GXU_MW_L64]